MAYVKRLFATFVGVLLLNISIANAVVVIDFGTGLAGSGGTISQSGGDVTGTGILIGALEVQGAPVANGVYVVTNGFLNFDTAADTISIVGGVAGLSISDGTTLLSGSFNSFLLSIYPGPTEVFQADGPDTKGPELLEAIGLDVNTGFNFFGFSLESANGVVTSTDVINTAVPVPAAVWLFGSGLLGLVGIARRKAA